MQKILVEASDLAVKRELTESDMQQVINNQ